MSVVALLLFSSPVPPVKAQDAPAGPLAELVLVDGSTVRGRILSETDAFIRIDTPMLGELQIDRRRVRTVTYDVAGPPVAHGWRDDPDGNSLLLTPTARMLPKGAAYYRNFVLLFNNFGFAPADYLNLSFMMAFPVTSDVRIVSLGAKVRLLAREEIGVSVAASTSFWFVDEERAGTVGGIVTAGNLRRALTGALNYGFADGDGKTFVFVGGDLQIGPGVKLLAEYGNGTSAITDDHDFKGIINVGLRFFREQSSFTLTGFRPLEEESGDFLAFPLAMFSARF